jgi:excisionase family DNA binding protein
MMAIILAQAWYTPKEIAEILHVSRMTVYRWIDSGKLSPLCVHRPIRIPRSEVKKVLLPPR